MIPSNQTRLCAWSSNLALRLEAAVIYRWRRKWNRRLAWVSFLLAWCFVTSPGVLAASGVTNLRARQREGTGLVDIRYDLGTFNTNGVFVAVAVSTNGGISFILPATSFTGDIGYGIRPGNDKLVVWDAARDWPDNFSTNIFFRLIAFDEQTGMVHIPAGQFVMGNTFTDEGESDELPLHTTRVSSLTMDKYHVTQALWNEVRTWALTNGYSFDNSGLGKAANHPVHSMSWYDAVKWCNARSEKVGLVPAYYTSAAQMTVYRTGQLAIQNDWVKWTSGYRLPTESEWEKAARGGVAGMRFPWADANVISHIRANYFSVPFYSYDTSPSSKFHPQFNMGSIPNTNPVDYFDANGYGLHDMAGNLFQWCWDWYGSYGAGLASDAHGPESGSKRVVRGGSWSYGPPICRVAARYYFKPCDMSIDVGFRSVLP